MTDLSRDDILNCNDLKMEKLHIKEWGGDVYIKQMTGIEQDKFEQETRGKNGAPNLLNLRAKLAAAVLVDSDGNKLFTDADIVKLSGKSGLVLNKIIDKSAELNALSEDDLEVMAKNL